MPKASEVAVKFWDVTYRLKQRALVSQLNFEVPRG